MYAGHLILQSHLCHFMQTPPSAAALALARALCNCPCSPGLPPTALICQDSLYCYQPLHAGHARLVFRCSTLLQVPVRRGCRNKVKCSPIRGPTKAAVFQTNCLAHARIVQDIQSKPCMGSCNSGIHLLELLPKPVPPGWPYRSTVPPCLVNKAQGT